MLPISANESQFVPDQLLNFVSDHVQERHKDLLDDEEFTRVFTLALIASVDFLVSCGHMEVLQTRWSTITQDSELASHHWQYGPPGATASFGPTELTFFRQKSYENGQSALDHRIEKLGRYCLDPQEETNGLGYVIQFLNASGVDRGYRWQSVARTILWSVLIWTTSDSGWDFLLEPVVIGGPPRSRIAWGISCMNQPGKNQPWGVAIQPSTPSESIGVTNFFDSEDTNDFFIWGSLLYPEHLEDRGDSVSCVSCGVKAHCLKRVYTSYEDEDGSLGQGSVYLCDHCREDALYKGTLTDEEENIPEDEGGTGVRRHYDCLRRGRVLRPFCKQTETCPHNQQEHLLSVLEDHVKEKTDQRVMQLQDGTHELLGVLDRPEQLRQLLGNVFDS